MFENRKILRSRKLLKIYNKSWKSAKIAKIKKKPSQYFKHFIFSFFSSIFQFWKKKMFEMFSVLKKCFLFWKKKIYIYIHTLEQHFRVKQILMWQTDVKKQCVLLRMPSIWKKRMSENRKFSKIIENLEILKILKQSWKSRKISRFQKIQSFNFVRFWFCLNFSIYKKYIFEFWIKVMYFISKVVTPWISTIATN